MHREVELYDVRRTLLGMEPQGLKPQIRQLEHQDMGL